MAKFEIGERVVAEHGPDCRFQRGIVTDEDFIGDGLHCEVKFSMSGKVWWINEDSLRKPEELT